jgi:hypothetical protein
MVLQSKDEHGSDTVGVRNGSRNITQLISICVIRGSPLHFIKQYSADVTLSQSRCDDDN